MHEESGGRWVGSNKLVELKKKKKKTLRFKTHSVFLKNYCIGVYIVGLMGCVNFHCAKKCFPYTCSYILFHTLFHHGLSQDSEYRCLCRTLLFVQSRYCVGQNVGSQGFPYHLMESLK